MNQVFVAWCDENIQRLAELVAVNGGSLDPKGAKPTPTNTVWRRKGLTINEAFDLVALVQYACGIMAGCGQDYRKQLADLIQEEIRKKESGTNICIATEDERRKLRI